MSSAGISLTEGGYQSSRPYCWMLSLRSQLSKYQQEQQAPEMPILPFIYTARIAEGAIRMMRSTSRSTPRNIAVLLLCPLLLLAAAARGQSDSPSSQSTVQPGTSDSQSTSGAPAADQSNPLHTASRTELDVVKVLVAQERAWNAGDIDGFVKSYKDSPETIFIGKQVSKGYQQILDDYRHN